MSDWAIWGALILAGSAAIGAMALQVGLRAALDDARVTFGRVPVVVLRK